MSPRAIVISVLALSTFLLLAVATLAMLSAQSEQGMLQEPHESSAREMSAPSSGGSCDGTAPDKQVAIRPAGVGRAFRC